MSFLSKFALSSRRVPFALCIAAVVLIGVFIFAFHQTSKHIPAALLTAQKQVDFPLFYPTNLPSGFSIIDGSISATSDVVLYDCQFEDSKISIAIQPLDPALDTSTFRPTSEFTTTAGHAYLVKYDTRVTVAIVGDKSLILMNAQKAVTEDAMEQLAKSLTPF